MSQQEPTRGMYDRAEAAVASYDALSSVYGLLRELPAPALASFTTLWSVGGWQISRGNGGGEFGQYIGHKLPGYKQLIGRDVVQIAANALKSHRPTSPVELLALDVIDAGELVENEYRLAADSMHDDLGFVLYAGQPYRRFVRELGGSRMEHILSAPAAVLWSQRKQDRGAGRLAQAVERVRAIELIALEG